MSVKSQFDKTVKDSLKSIATPQLRQLNKVADTPFVKLYTGTYDLPDGKVKNYNIVSRTNITDIKNTPVAAVTVFATNKTGDKMLLLKEFRYPVNSYVIDMPSGLIDEGETVVEAGLRELLEETGYDKVTVDKVLPASYSSVGLTNERVATIKVTIDESSNLGQAIGDDENISFKWVTKEQVKTLLETATNIAARTQLAMWVFTNESYS